MRSIAEHANTVSDSSVFASAFSLANAKDRVVAVAFAKNPVVGNTGESCGGEYW